jgi:hypothetical protein
VSVYELADTVISYGGVFIRDPWTRRIDLLHADRVPQAVVSALKKRWGDLEALLSEHRPPDPVSIAERLLVPA